MHFISPVLNSSSAIMIPSITKQSINDENSAKTFSAALQQQSVSLILCQTSELLDVMILSTTPTGKSGHHIFIILKSTSEVSMSITSSSQRSITTLPSSMILIIILLASVSSVVFVVDNLYSNKGLNIIIKFLKSVFQYSLLNYAQFSEELKLLNDYFKDYKTDAGLNKNALN